MDATTENAKVTRDLSLGFRVLSDPQLKAIDAYGVRHANAPGAGDIARPAGFLIDRDGVVRWRDLTANYRVRPRPETILAELDKIR